MKCTSKGTRKVRIFSMGAQPVGRWGVFVYDLREICTGPFFYLQQVPYRLGIGTLQRYLDDHGFVAVNAAEVGLPAPSEEAHDA